MADKDILITVFQGWLRSGWITSKEICEHLTIDRTTVYSWKKGVSYPNKDNADKLIRLFRARGVELDYNQIYRPSISQGDVQ